MVNLGAGKSPLPAHLPTRNAATIRQPLDLLRIERGPAWIDAEIVGMLRELDAVLSALVRRG